MSDVLFQQSVREQIAVNRARTPTERFLRLCDLLDTVRAMAPDAPQARERRQRALVRREREREALRAYCRHLIATGRATASQGI